MHLHLKYDLEAKPHDGWTIDDVCFYTADEEYLPEPDSGVEEDAGADGGPEDGGTQVGVKSGACSCDNAGADASALSILSLLF